MTEETAEAEATEEAEEQVENEEQENAEAEADADSAAEDSGEGEGSENGDVGAPEFSELNPSDVEAGPADLNRLNDVKVVVSAELGRTKVAIEDLLKLNVGSIFELNRSIDSPVELIAQGVPLGNGEVVVVDGSFAIRIQEIYAPQ